MLRTLVRHFIARQLAAHADRLAHQRAAARDAGNFAMSDALLDQVHAVRQLAYNFSR